MKMAYPETLRRINKLELNRSVIPEALVDLDPDGVCLLHSLMLHNDIEIRARVFLKIKNEVMPREVMMDIPLKDWNSMDDVPEDLKNSKLCEELSRSS